MHHVAVGDDAILSRQSSDAIGGIAKGRESRWGNRA